MNSDERRRWREIAGDVALDAALEDAETAALHELAAAPPELLEAADYARSSARKRAAESSPCVADHLVAVPAGETAFALTPTHLVLAVSLPLDEARALLATWREFAACEYWDDRTEQLFPPLFGLYCKLLDQVDE